MEKLAADDKIVCLNADQSPFLEEGYTYRVTEINMENKLGQDVFLRKEGEINRRICLLIRWGSKNWVKI